MSRLATLAGSLLIATSIALFITRSSGSLLILPILDLQSLVVASSLLGLGLAVLAWRYYSEYRSAIALDSQVPIAIRIVTDAHMAGLNIYQAFRLIAESGVRPLSDAARRFIYLVDVSGYSTDQALTEVAREYRRSVLFSRFAAILAEATKGGARFAEVLDTLNRIMVAVAEYHREKAVALRPHIVTYLFTLVVYIVIVDVLVYYLIPALKTFVAGGSLPLGGEIGIVVPERIVVVNLVNYLGVVESVLGGFVIGRIVFEDWRPGLLISGVSIIAIANGLYLPSVLLPQAQ